MRVRYVTSRANQFLDDACDARSVGPKPIANAL